MVVHAGKQQSGWTDMSDYVVHFTKDYGGRSAYDNMLSILGGRRIEAKSPFGFLRKEAPSIQTQYAVCFSEVPLHLLRRLAQNRSDYGIVFTKELVVQRHGNPILYAYKDNPIIGALGQLAASAKGDPEHPAWAVTPFIDAPGQYPNGSSYFFEWEREWRHRGSFKFAESEVKFLIIPEALHDAARSFFQWAEHENAGPAYSCGFIDPYWKLEKIEAVFSGT
jgi:hypothetical protein